MSLAERLKKLRTAQSLTIDVLANKLKLDKDLLIKWEEAQEEPSLLQLSALARFFDVSTDYLLGLENKNPLPWATPGLFPAFPGLAETPEKEMDDDLLNELIELTRAVDLNRRKK
ncbi:MAG: helix-turn-helix domain-containing protein [Peptococcaceae bacterium]